MSDVAQVNAPTQVGNVLKASSLCFGLGGILQRFYWLQQANQLPHPVLVAKNFSYPETIWEISANLQIPKYTKISYNIIVTLTSGGITSLFPHHLQTGLTGCGVKLLGTAVGSIVAQPLSVVNTWQTTQYIDHGFLSSMATWKRIPHTADYIYAGIVPGIFANYIESSTCFRLPAIISLQDALRNKFHTQNIAYFKSVRADLLNSLASGEDKPIDIPQTKGELIAILDSFFFDKVAEKIVDTFLRILAYPLNTLRYRIEAQGSSSLNPVNNYTVLELAKKIYSEEGFKGFYKGIELLLGHTGFDFALHLLLQAIFRVCVKFIRPDDQNKLKQFYLATTLLEYM